MTEQHADEQVPDDLGDQHDDLGDRHDDTGDQHDDTGDQHDDTRDQHDDLADGHDEPVDQHGGEQVPAELDDRPDPGLPDGADPRVAAAVARLDQLGDAPPAEHVEVYEDVHRVLQDALADAARPQWPAEQGQAGGSRQ